MLITRLKVIAVLLPIGLALILLGGIPYNAFVILILALAAWEYVQMFVRCGQQPAGALVVGGVVALSVARALTGLQSEAWLVMLFIMVSMGYHLWAYEKGRDQAGTDFGVTLAGILYFGCLGSYFISLRALPEGAWWCLITFTAIWTADAGAYLIGHTWGKHLWTPRLSPKKTWEGYLGGIICGTIFGFAFAFLWRALAGTSSQILPWHGALAGLVLGTLAPLGDLGESMVKRQAALKDSSHIIPGHGGIWDRMDSWLWAVPIGYYLTVWVFLGG